MAIRQSTVLFFALIAIIIMAVVIEAVPIDIDTAANIEDANTREERFYGYPGGVAGSSANAFAASNSFGLGGGLGISSANAVASASSGATGIGFPYGK